MAQPYFHDNRHRRTTTGMPMNNPMINENYEHELMNRERRFSNVEIDGLSMHCFFVFIFSNS